MAAPSITELPEKTINTFLSKWNASHLPIQYTINNDKFPVGESVTNYFTQVLISVNGILIATIKQIPDSSNNTKVDIRKYVQTALLFEISDALRDTNASAEFFITGSEEYIDSSGVAQSNAITGGGAGVVHFASLSSLQFGSANGGNMYDFVLDQTKLDLTKWMTFFERGFIIDTTSFTLSLIVNDPGFDLEVIQFDINDNVISTSLTAIADEGVGLYRLSLSGITFDITTSYATVQALVTSYGTAISELFTLDVDLECADSPEAPTLLIASNATSEEIDLNWTSNSNGEESGFGVERSLSQLGPFSLIGTTLTGVVAFTDTSLSSDTEFFYRVRALGAIPSAYTNIASAKTLGFALTLDGVNDVMNNTTDKLILGDGQSAANNFTIAAVLKCTSNGSTAGASVAQTANGGFYLGYDGNAAEKVGVDLFVREDSSSGARFGNAISDHTVAAGQEFGVSRFIACDRISNTINGNWLSYMNGSEITMVQGSGNLLAATVIALEDITFGGIGFANFEYGGIIDNAMVFQPELTLAQKDFIFNGNAENVKDPRTAEAKTQGIGVSGVDTIGVGGITTLLLRYWRFNQLFKSGGADYGFTTKQSGIDAFIKEEITNDNNYAVDANYAVGTDILIQF